MTIRNIFKTNRLDLKLGPIMHRKQVDYRLISPFARSTKWLLIMGFFLLPFVLVEVHVFKMALTEWQRSDQLFSLVGALFQTFWLIGWSFGVGIMLLIYTLMLMGRQVVLVHSGMVDTIIGVPGIGVRIRLAASEINDVSLVAPQDTSVFPKRGKQLQLITDEGDENSAFGSDHTEQDRQRLLRAIEKNRTIDTELDSMEQLKAMKANVVEDIAPEVEMPSTPAAWNSPSTLILILANLVPLIGVAFFDWDLGATMVLYWAETAIILLYTVLKQITLNPVLGIFTSLFTIAHAGGFMAVHFLFIWTLFVQTESGFSGNTSVAEVSQYLITLWPALLALVLSHGFSFKANFLNRKNRTQKKLTDKDFYSRIILMHVTIIFGGGAALVLGSGLFAIAFLVLLKIAVDVTAHRKQHTR